MKAAISWALAALCIYLALMVMRNVEDYVLRKPGQSINLRVPTDVALSPDDARLYVAFNAAGTLQVWDAATRGFYSPSGPSGSTVRR